jgi:hypothetical protein
MGEKPRNIEIHIDFYKGNKNEPIQVSYGIKDENGWDVPLTNLGEFYDSEDYWKIA